MHEESKIWLWIRSQWKAHSKLYSHILTVIVTLIWAPYITNLFLDLTRNLLQSKQLSFEVVSLDRYTKSEIKGLAVANQIEEFRFNLDDPIIPDYYLRQSKTKERGHSNSWRFTNDCFYPKHKC